MHIISIGGGRQNYVKEKVDGLPEHAVCWEEFADMGKMTGICKGLLRVAAIILTLLYPGFMAVMSAAGWHYNVNNGSYPALFNSLAGWMYAGSGLLLCAMVLVLLGANPKRWQCNIAAAAAGTAGCAACMSALHRFCVYADQNFSGIGENLRPVSDLYRVRLLPILAAAALLVGLSLWQLFSDAAKEERIRRKQVRAAQENAPAPKILGD